MKVFTREKFNRLKRLSTESGIITALAIDQRGSIEKTLSKAYGRTATKGEIKTYKAVVAKELTPYTSAILLDTQYGEEAIRTKDTKSGLIISYEKTDYDAEDAYRLPDLLDDLSVIRIANIGADAIKILLYYNSDDPEYINERKHAFVERVGSECLALDMPFFLEIITYDQNITDVKGLEYAKIKPEKTNSSVVEFSKDRYNADVLKIELPISLRYIGEGEDEFAYTMEKAVEHFNKTSASAKIPFIYLSAGVSAEEFRDTLKLAIKAGTNFSGVLCGRATWKDGVNVYAKDGEEALIKWLKNQGRHNVEALNEMLNLGAKPWWGHFGGLDEIEIKG